MRVRVRIMARVRVRIMARVRVRVRVRVTVRVQVLPCLDAQPRLEQRLHGGGRLASH